MKSKTTNRTPSLGGIVLGLVGALLASGSTMASAQLAPVTAAQLGKGTNVGNSLDAINNSRRYPWTTSQETYWGNPPLNQQIFNGIAAAGFKSVRIPVSWFQYMDRNNTIQPFWLARVKQVVDMARNAGLYVILNQHHHNGELEPVNRNSKNGNAKLKALWTQVGNYFKNYDNHLLFAGTNEIMRSGDYGAPTAEYCNVQTSFNQTFVDAVRATGGNNASRTLVVQAFNTNTDYSIDQCGAKVPADTTTSRLMMEIHYYSPYNFALNDQSSIWQWGSIAVDPAVTETWANEAYVEAHFDKAKAAYADKGIPVILGEYCAIAKKEYDATLKYRDYWDKYITGSAIRHGFATYYWDAGYPTENHSCGLFDRSTGAGVTTSTINAVITAQ